MKTYTTNRVLSAVITLMVVAGIASIDFEELKSFYKEPELFFLIAATVVVLPMLLFFGFGFQIKAGEVVNRSYFLVKRGFKISDISHVLYQPTWAGIMPLSSKTNMRSLHIVRNSGGWRETISLTNAGFREGDLADIAQTLRLLNPRVILDEHAEALIKKHEGSSHS